MEVEKYLEKISKKFGTPIKELRKTFETRKKNAMEAYEYTEEKASKFAADSIYGDIQRKISEKSEEFVCIITGTDGRMTNWADVLRKQTDKKIADMKKKGKTDQDVISAGLKSSDGKYLYPDDDKAKRGGKTVPEKDMSGKVEGLANVNGKYVPITISGKFSEILDIVSSKKIQKISGRVGDKSSKEEISISVKDRNDVTEVKELGWSDFTKACEKLYGKYTAGFKQLVEMSENLPAEFSKRKVTVKDVQVISVKKDIGERKSILVSVQVPDSVDNMDTPEGEKYGTITVWLPKEVGFEPYQHQVVSFSGLIGKPDTERGNLTINASSMWCEESFLMTEKPETLNEKEEKEDELQAF